jgi:hypothetical protein
MATPSDLSDLAIGFSLTEGIVRSASEIEKLDVVPGQDGIELRMWLTPDSGRQFKKRQRRLTGPTGCGLCGVESLTAALRPSPRPSRVVSLSPSEIEQAVAALTSAQSLNHKTCAAHAAGFYSPRKGFVAAREDAGRQCARQIGGRPCCSKRPGRDWCHHSHEPRIHRDGSENGSENGRHRIFHPGCHIRADRAGGENRRGLRHHIGRHRARARFRNIHVSNGICHENDQRLGKWL